MPSCFFVKQINFNQMKKYTFKEIAHLYYGCQCQLFWKNEDGSLEFERVGKLIEIKPKTEREHPLVFECKTSEDSKFTTDLAYDYSEVKPILRNLKSMTKDEKILFHNENRLTATNNILPEIQAGNLTNWFHSPRGVLVTVWLLSRHFDLFGLIDSGEAVQHEA
jgi:hypothetical protein